VKGQQTGIHTSAPGKRHSGGGRYGIISSLRGVSGIGICGKSSSSKSITLCRANADIVAPEEPTITIFDATSPSRCGPYSLFTKSWMTFSVLPTLLKNSCDTLKRS
jgi:hypothetical protein